MRMAGRGGGGGGGSPAKEVVRGVGVEWVRWGLPRWMRGRGGRGGDRRGGAGGGAQSQEARLPASRAGNRVVAVET